MKILVTGAAGFVGKNLVAALNCIKDGKDRTHPALAIDEIFSYILIPHRKNWKMLAKRRILFSILRV